MSDSKLATLRREVAEVDLRSLTFDGIRVLREKVAAAASSLEREFKTLAEADQLTASQENRFNQLSEAVTGYGELKDEIHTAWVARMEVGIADGSLQSIEGSQPGSSEYTKGPHVMTRTDPWSDAPMDPFEPNEARSRARTAIERWAATDNELRQGATETVDRLDVEDAVPVSEFIVKTSNPLYIRAFRKYIRDPQGFGAELDPAERAAWSSVKAYSRAALGLSGAVLPSPLSPEIVLSNAGTLDPMRSVARIETTIANTKRFITSAGVTASFDAELTEVSDDTPSLTEVTITCRKAQAFAQASIEAWMDQPDITSEVAKMFADAKARLEGLKFIKGVAGSNEPVGIETALAGTSSEVNAAGEALVANDVYGLIEALPVRWRNVAKWQTELSTRNFIHRLWNPTGTEPPMIEGSNLIGTPYVLNSNVDPYSGVLASETATNRVLIVGDWKQFAILDRVGLEVEFIPHLFNTANNLPDGRRGWYCYWRVGSDSLIDGAFKMLDVQTAA